MRNDDLTEEEYKYREKCGALPVNDVVCSSCANIGNNNKICWKCDSGSNFLSATRTLKQIHNQLMGINVSIGEALASGATEQTKTISTIAYAEALKWVIEPFGNEEDLYALFGFQYEPEED